MDGGQQSKQQIIDRLKSTTNILITVSTNPSVDELSAALSLTLLLNKMKKQATAVFSGAIPPAIQFLEPEKTFEGTVDSLRDFIVALDKQKAGRIKYKVDGNMVRIFITPYRTVITQKDLEFSQGDFNVETIVALGVERREEIDKAITAHGRILHDATVVTISAKNESNNLGSIDWQEGKVSSLCEMLMSMTDDLGPDLLDAQIATALLTGIVSATGRFSNQKTSPRAMTMAAQLMAAGANQQLIATKLQDRLKPLATPPNVKPVDATQDDASEDGTVVLNPRAEAPSKAKDTTSNGKNTPKTESKAAAQPSTNNEPATDNDEPEVTPALTPQKKKAVGEIEISHQDEPTKPAQPATQAPKTQAVPTESSQTPVGTLPDAFKAVAAAPKAPVAPVESTEDYALSPDQYAERRQKAAIAEAEEELASALPQAAPSSQMPSFEDLQSEIKAMEQAQDAPEPAPVVEVPEPAPMPAPQQAEPVSVPSMPPPPAQPQFSPLPTPIAPAEPKQSPKADAGAPALSPAEPRESASQPSWMEREITEPTLGGSLSATTQQAAEDKLAEEGDAERRNHTILNHRGDGGHNSRPVSPITLPEPNPVAPSELALFSPLPAATAPAAPTADIAPAPQPAAEPVQDRSVV